MIEKSNSQSAMFRPQVMEAKSKHWLGAISVAAPLPLKVITGAAVVLASAIFAFLSLTSYTRRAHARGVMEPASGLVVIKSPADARVSFVLPRIGQTVREDDELIGLSASYSSVARAPISGVVYEISVDKDSDVVQGQALLSILPESAILNAHVFTNSDSVGWMREGQNAAISFSSPTGSHTYMANGIVKKIEAVPSRSDSGSPMHEEKSYSVDIAISPKSLRSDSNNSLAVAPATLEATVFIERRTLMGWLFSGSRSSSPSSIDSIK